MLNNGHSSCPAPKIFKEDMKINWHDTLINIYNKVRGLAPFPSAWFEMVSNESNEVVSAKVYAVEIKECEHNGELGQIVTDGKTYAGVCANGGIVYIKELQIAGKKRMGIADFLRGFNIAQFAAKI